VIRYYDDSKGAHHSFIYDHGTYTTISPPGDTINVSASDINNRGDIVGSFGFSNGNGSHGFIASATGRPGAAGTATALSDVVSTPISMLDLVPIAGGSSGQGTLTSGSGIWDAPTAVNASRLDLFEISQAQMIPNGSG
jgi:hypothetical protein